MEENNNNELEIIVDSDSGDRGDKKSTPAVHKKKMGNVNDKMAVRYKKAYNKLYNELPKWKQLAIAESIKNKKQNDSLCDEFIHNVVLLAESQEVL